MQHTLIVKVVGQKGHDGVDWHQEEDPHDVSLRVRCVEERQVLHDEPAVRF